MENNFTYLQKWYREQCNGDWEHEYGIEIKTLDNPGWLVKIDLEGTEFENVDFKTITIHRTEQDWIDCKLDFNPEYLKTGRKVKQFMGAGGPNNLEEILETFRNISEDVS